MKHSAIIAIIAALLSFTAHAADPPPEFKGRIQSIIALDTILDLRVPYERPGRIPAALDGHTFWYYVESKDPTDTLLFLRVDLVTRQIDSVHAIFPNLRSRLRSAGMLAMAADEQNVVTVFFKAVATFQRVGPNLLALSAFRETPAYDYAAFQQPNVFLSWHYDRGSNGPQSPTEINILPTRLDTIFSRTSPAFDYIEFTYFRPNRFIDATGNRALFAQTGTYSLAVMDRDLRPIATVERRPRWWSDIDSTAFAAIRSSSAAKNGYTRNVIQMMEPINAASSRLTGAYFLSDSCILVQSILPENIYEHVRNVYDVWRFSNGVWACSDSDLVDVMPDDSEICTPSNHILFGHSDQFYSRDFMAVVAPAAPVQRFGRTYAEIKAKEDDYFTANEPTRHLFIYRIRENAP